MVNETVGVDDAVERLYVSMSAFTRRARATSQRLPQPTSELTRSEVSVLRVVAEGEGSRPGTIAARLCTSPSVVSRQLATLTEHGLVERRRDPADGRAEQVTISARGTQVLTSLRAAYLARLRDQTADWDVARISEAAELVDQLADMLAGLTHDEQCSDENVAKDTV